MFPAIFAAEVPANAKIPDSKMIGGSLSGRQACLPTGQASGIKKKFFGRRKI
jgi:hypothetical protein